MSSHFWCIIRVFCDKRLCIITNVICLVVLYFIHEGFHRIDLILIVMQASSNLFGIIRESFHGWSKCFRFPHVRRCFGNVFCCVTNTRWVYTSEYRSYGVWLFCHFCYESYCILYQLSDHKAPSESLDVLHITVHLSLKSFILPIKIFKFAFYEYHIRVCYVFIEASNSFKIRSNSSDLCFQVFIKLVNGGQQLVMFNSFFL